MPGRPRLLLAAVLLASGGALALTPAPTRAAPIEFVPVEPVRLLDTRYDHASFDGREWDGPIHGNDIVKFQVTGRGEIPGEVVAVALNVTAVEPLAAGFLTVWPCNAQIPTASNVNYTPRQTVANAVVTGTDSDGYVCVKSLASADVVVDVSGYFPVTSTYRPLVPVRVDDTRTQPEYWMFAASGQYLLPFREVDDGTPDDPSDDGGTPFDAARTEVPWDAEAVLLNVTATETLGPGYVSTYDCYDDPYPLESATSTLNYSTAGATVANLALAKLTNSDVCFKLRGTGELVVDLFGYFPAGSGYTAINPVRVLDTRPTEGGEGRLAAGEEYGFAAGAAAGAGPGATVGVNVTVTGTQGPGYVSVYPCGTDPTTSTVNFTGAGQTVANAAIVSPGQQGMICYTASTATHIVVDVTGYF